MTKFEDTVFRSYPTGSRYICNPPPTDTDNDTVFLVNGFYDYASILANDGWEDCGEYDDTTGNFRAFRKGDQNYIVTENDTFFERYVVATEGAKALNLLNKDDRINLFRAIVGSSSGTVGFRVINPLELVKPAKAVFDIEADGLNWRLAQLVPDHFFDRGVFVGNAAGVDREPF